MKPANGYKKFSTNDDFFVGFFQKNLKITAALFQTALNLSFAVAFGQAFPFIVKFFAAGQGQLHLNQGLIEVKPHRHQCQAFFPHSGVKPGNFRFVQQQAARPLFLVVVNVSKVVVADMQILKPHLAALN